MLLVLMAAGCDQAKQDTTTTVSVIGDKGNIVGSSTAQGLVSFDADGQIEPALAERWIVSDDGLSLAFRLARSKWSNGRPVVANEVAHSLQESFARAPTGRLGHLFNAVEGVVAMTGRVIEIRLKEPRPNMLQLLAQPEFAVRHNGFGAGPYTLQKSQKDATILSPMRAGDGSEDDVSDNEMRSREIRLQSGRAALAVARYIRGQSDAVLGGSFIDYPLVQTAKLRPSQIITDATRGLFGFAFAGQHPLTSEPVVRQALDMAIDRATLAQALGLPNWQTREALLPAQLDSAIDPTVPDWAGLSLSLRRTEAARRIAVVVGGSPHLAPLRVALPDGPGSRLLFARISADWRAIGVSSEAVGWREPADVRLIDEVAPSGSVNWYFTRLSCGAGVICDQKSDDALAAARDAETLDARAQAYARADQAYAANLPFISLGNPFRWSLTSARLTGLRSSPFGVHPLVRVRSPRN